MEDKNSFIIFKLLSFFNKLNEFYEYSVTYKVFNKIGTASFNSFIIGNCYKKFTSPTHINYAEGSLIITTIFRVFSVIFNFLKQLYVLLAKLNLTSKNKKIFDKFIAPLTSIEKGVPAIFSVLSGVFFIRVIISILSGFGISVIIINTILCLIFILLTFVNFSFLSRVISGSFPIKIINWLFKE